jgi:hypothetical protein
VNEFVRAAFEADGQEITYSADQREAAREALWALREVESVFAGYRLSDELNYCPCCTEPEFIERLKTSPRDRVSAPDAASFFMSALDTLGNANDLKYFVPRLCSDALSGTAGYDVDCAFAKLLRADFVQWPIAERNALAHCLTAAWRCFLRAVPSEERTADLYGWAAILDAMATLGFINAAVDVLQSEHGAIADAQLLKIVAYVDLDAEPLKPVTAGGFCDNVAAYRSFERWLLLPEVSERITHVLRVRTLEPSLTNCIEESLAELDRRRLRCSLPSGH